MEPGQEEKEPEGRKATPPAAAHEGRASEPEAESGHSVDENEGKAADVSDDDQPSQGCLSRLFSCCQRGRQGDEGTRQRLLDKSQAQTLAQTQAQAQAQIQSRPKPALPSQ